MLTVLLVRHADSIHPNAWDGDEYTRPLSEQGLVHAQTLGTAWRARHIDAVYSSPHRRAVQTVTPLAADRGLPVQLVSDLREHQLAPQPIAQWREVLEASWRDFRAAPGGADSLAATQERALDALEHVRCRHEGRRAQTLAIGGHGTLFACLLHALRPNIDCAFLLAMPMPAVYELVHAAGRWSVLSGPGLDADGRGRR